MKKNILILSFLLSIPYLNSMNYEFDDNSKLDIFAIPGQNGLGSETDYLKKLLNENQINITQVTTPSLTPDLGQSRCLSHLRNTISKNKAQKILIHATSQGTATALNYLAHEDKGQRIKGLILEAVLASGNRAIEQTLKGPLMNLPLLVKLPFSYYWIAYIAKALFPLYWPAGKQPIKSISKIPIDIPIVIIHSKKDPQLSYDDACALYYALKSNGNNNVYLITKEGMRHIQITIKDDQKVLQSILNKHKLLKYPNIKEDQDLSLYQPDHKQFEKLYNDIISKEKNHERIGVLLTIGIFCLLVKVMMNYMHNIA